MDRASVVSKPTVAAVIPTILRSSAELLRAVNSALTQTYPVAEVVVVVDLDEGPLPRFEDPRVRVVRNTGRHGPAAARNAGVSVAHADLIAWLDDDDHWLPRKLEKQVERYLAAERPPRTIVTSRARMEAWGRAWVAPDAPSGAESLADYLFPAPRWRRSLTQSVYTPTLLIPRLLLTEHPLDESLTQWEDYEWLLRVADAGTSLVWVWDPLTVCDQERSSGISQSQILGADRDAAWCQRHLAHRSERAHHTFMLTYVASQLAFEGRRREAVALQWRALRAGAAAPPLLVKSIGSTVVHPRVWEKLRALRKRGDA